MTSPHEANYDESKVPQYELPNPLVCQDGTEVTTPHLWKSRRRSEILEIFKDQVYGYCPDGAVTSRAEIIAENTGALGGLATQRQIKLWIGHGNSEICVNLLLHFPNHKRDKSTFPTFLGYNFKGNHATSSDSAIFVNELRRDQKRGENQRRWPFETIIKRGYASVTACYFDVDPDVNDLTDGAHALFYKPGETHPAPNGWGSISAWAWGLSRMLDYLETVQEIDAERVVVHGHSRLGKTALWAGALDPRFAVTISNDSGCGGAAISRRCFGETVARINTSFPHWFCDNFKQYNNNEPALPIDQHQLISLIAPRPVYVASATEDLWADPRGEFLSASAADSVYQLLGKTGVKAREMPQTGNSIGDTIGYHIRAGKHDVVEEDWLHFLDFTDRHFGR